MHYKVQGFQGPVAPRTATPIASPLLQPAVQSAAQQMIVQNGPNTAIYAPPEPAIKHVYEYRTGRWTKQEISVQVATQPFQEGTLRIIYYMKDFSLNQTVVAKISKDRHEPVQTYFLDVEMQGVAKKFAEAFNAQNPPKRIDFVIPYVIELKRTNKLGQKIVMGVEPLLHGRYHKHSNNYGFVSHEDRNTPQAFSHYTYHSSGGKMLVCDIQGVDDIYTDPQIHCTTKHQRFGKADMGVEGVRKFFETHRCNAICEFLRLPAYKKKDRGLPIDVIHRPISQSVATEQEGVQVQGMNVVSPVSSVMSPVILSPPSMTTRTPQQMKKIGVVAPVQLANGSTSKVASGGSQPIIILQ